ncbi:hypothetical protein GQ53DRAFT_818738 [Thozetella sp. PMI_491]|nr:hypothetical protein GQ53DRAFT_818738 [Thozetella sp. PMI_491]
MASPDGVSLQITLYLGPNVQQYLDILKPTWEKLTAEPELLFFEIYESLEEPGTLYIVEDWAGSKEWLTEVQLKKDYYADYFERTPSLHVKQADVRIVKRIAPKMLVSKIPVKE